MFAKDYRRAAWNKLSGHWIEVVVAYVIYSLMVAVAGTTGIGLLLLSGVFTVGMSLYVLQLVRFGNFKLEYIFGGFSQGLGSNIVAGILVPLFTFLWSLLFWIPGIIKTYSYSMTYYILADNPEMAPTDAITESRKLMNGKKWKLFCLDFSFIGWYLLSVLTFGILALWIAPYHMTARAEFYESIKPQPAQDDAFFGGMANDGAERQTISF